MSVGREGNPKETSAGQVRVVTAVSITANQLRANEVEICSCVALLSRYMIYKIEQALRNR